jgi:hypothetical protein
MKITTTMTCDDFMREMERSQYNQFDRRELIDIYDYIENETEIGGHESKIEFALDLFQEIFQKYDIDDLRERQESNDFDDLKECLYVISENDGVFIVHEHI